MVASRRVAGVVLALSVALLGCSAAHRHTELTPHAPHEAGPAAFTEPSGVGSLEARTEGGDASLARLVKVHVTATQRGDMAEVETEHVFHNDSNDVLEGTFRFPLPDGAILTGLAMMIDGRLMEGELVERDKARKIYEAIVDGMQDPALLEWEHGSIFKVRVFPIEPRKDKLVVVRYLAPLQRSEQGLHFVQSARSASGSEPLGELVVDWQGRRVFEGREVPRDRLVSVAATPASDVLRESRVDGVYAAVRLRPDWRRVPPPKPSAARAWFIIVDTSRSALEELPRALEALTAVLRSLPPGSRFQVVTSDLEARPAPGALQPVTEATVAGALAFVQSMPPDGASDLGRAFALVGELSASVDESAVVYIGDAEPTWGLTEPRALVEELRRRLPHRPLHSLLIGSSVNDELAEELARASGGRRARVRHRSELEAFTRTLSRPSPTLTGVKLVGPPGTELIVAGPAFLEPTRDLQLFLKAPPGRDPLRGVTARAELNGSILDLLPRAAAQEVPGVARRFGAAKVRDLEMRHQPPAAVVQASLDYGVMSKLTSFLVLESEEAYARFAIERKRSQSPEGPRVTGANLESTEGADISAGRVQPGDPEIFVDAEREARSVTVALPFGETKVAVYDSEARGGRGAWMVRFLVPPATPAGDYEAIAHIVHSDGSAESRRVRYSVDSTGPTLNVRLLPSPRRAGWTEVWVSQPGDARLSDLKRVELRTPSGAVHQLVAVRWGVFRALVRQSELRTGTLRVVGFDLALNHTVAEVPLP